AAAGAAIRTHRFGAHDLVGDDRQPALLLDLGDLGRHLAVGERAGRAGVDALAAHLAARLLEAAVEPGRDGRIEAAAARGQRGVALDLVADAHAAVAVDAARIVT